MLAPSGPAYCVKPAAQPAARSLFTRLGSGNREGTHHLESSIRSFSFGSGAAGAARASGNRGPDSAASGGAGSGGAYDAAACIGGQQSTDRANSDTGIPAARLRVGQRLYR